MQKDTNTTKIQQKIVTNKLYSEEETDDIKDIKDIQ